MSRPEILVIGAGVVGACVAYRLAEAGARVTVLDAAMPGTGTSSTSFAWINSFGKVPREYHDLNVAGMAEHERLAGELSFPWLHQVGNLEWEEEAGQQARLRATVARLRGWDYAVEMIRPAQALELEPGLSISPAVEEVAFAPRDGYVEVVPLIGALLAAAGRLGARILTGRRVIRLSRTNGRVTGAADDRGATHAADCVVSCAGPATAEIAALASLKLAVGGEPGQLHYTAPVASLLTRPVHAPGVQIRPDGGGRIVLSEEAHDLVLERAPQDGWTPEQSVAAAARYYPALTGARVEATRVGVRPMPQDRLPAVGFIPGLDGFYVVVSHSGVTLGPLWGQIAAREVLAGAVDPRLAPFRPARLL